MLINMTEKKCTIRFTDVLFKYPEYFISAVRSIVRLFLFVRLHNTMAVTVPRSNRLTVLFRLLLPVPVGPHLLYVSVRLITSEVSCCGRLP